MSFTLTTGAIEGIMSGELLDRPVLQVLGQKKIAGAQGPDRYRLLLSDGKHSHSSAMLATQLNEKITSGQMDTHSVIRLDKYICNPIQPDRRVMILLELTVLACGAEVDGRIGNPQPLRSSAGDQNAAVSSSVTTQEPAGNAVNTAKPAVSAPAATSSSSMMSSSSLSTSSSVPAAGSNQPPAKSFYGAAAPATPQSHNSRVYNGGAPTGFADTPSNIHPIASLTPYQNRWTIRGRVTQKSGIRTWSNSRGEGRLFSIILVDESGEIRATAFTQEVDKFYNLIEVNKVYYVRKATLKTANKQFSSCNNDYEMTFNSETEMVPCDDDSIELPSLTFNFVPINKMEERQPNSIIDCIGVVKNVDDIRLLTSKQGRELKKRDVTLVDEAQVQIRLTLWGDDAESFNGTGNPIIAIKGCRLSDWSGRSLSAVSSSQIIINPDITEAHTLRGWYDSFGSSANYTEYRRDGDTGAAGSGGGTNWKTFAEVKGQNLGQGQKADYFTSKGTVVFLKKDNCMYMACPQQDCNKKVVDNGNGTYRCEKCNREFPNFKWRMILSVNLADFSDNQWVTCFQETAEQLLGKKADEIGHMKDHDEPAFDHLFSEANFKSFIFRLRAKMETFNDENRLKTVCVQANPVNCKDYNQKLLTDIEAILGPIN